MSDETSQAIFGDAVAASLEKPGPKGRGLFPWKKPEKEKPPFTHCEDCGAELHGRYCSNCGQVAVDYHRSFRHVVADVAESFLNWDSKFTKTLLLLVIYPGWLTNQFVAGRRTRYLHPLRLYLLVSIVFFLCIRLAPIQTRPQVAADMTPKDRAEVEEAMKNPAIPALVREEVLKSVAERTKTPAAKKAGPARPAELTSPSPAPVVGGHSKLLDDGASPSWLKRKVKEKIGPHGSNVQLLIKTLRDNISTMMLFCIPLFALVLKVLYLRQHRFYVEHLVYALHIHSFFYIARSPGRLRRDRSESLGAGPRRAACLALRPCNRGAGFSLDPAGLSPELVCDDLQVLLWRLHLPVRPHPGPGHYRRARRSSFLEPR